MKNIILKIIPFTKENWFKLIIAICAVIFIFSYISSIDSYEFINCDNQIWVCNKNMGNCRVETGLPLLPSLPKLPKIN